MTTDELYAKKQCILKDFDFGKETAAVFDDMLLRSVPCYTEVQRMISEITTDFAVKGTSVYDLGCSTCNTFLILDPVISKEVRFVGVDSSPEMLQRGREKLTQYGITRDYDLLCADLNEGVHVNNASTVIMNLTLMFVRPLRRSQLIESIASGINKGGCLVVVEKVLSGDPKLNRLFIKCYYELKQRNGYSDLEIAQKREALENVLIPYRVEDNIELMLRSGFSTCDVFFKWYNFCGLIAVK